MSDIAEGIGGAIEGALTGRAVEKDRGEMHGPGAGSGEEASPDQCLNCGAQTAGNFCANCGQKVHVHRTLSAIGHDLIHGVLHLDGKFWRTLPLLTFKPGQITRRYVEGERARFVSPMAMFLFSVFAMFAVFQMVGLTTPTNLDFDTPIRAEATAEAERLRSQIESLSQDDPEREELLSRVRFLEEVLQREDIITTNPETAEPGAQAGAEEPIADLRDFNLDLSLTGIEALDQGIFKKWKENPGLMLYKLQANGYKFSWLLIPLSVPFVWLMFAWKRRFRAYDHAVFVTYSLSFMSLLFIVISLVGVSSLGAGMAVLIFAIAAPLHVYKHLRYAYGLSRLSAIWRFFALFFFIIIVLLLFLQALLLLGAF